MLYAILEFGFEPQLALNQSDSGENRLNKIIELIKLSKYSIHDLSRIKSSKTNEYYRLNMPFELGVDYGTRLAAKPDKLFLILEGEEYEYQKALSDISGWDIKCHENKSLKILECIRSWFVETVKLTNLKTGLEIFYQYSDFEASLSEQLFKNYEQKYEDSKARAISKNHIENMPIPEYIKYVKKNLEHKQKMAQD
jgi:hypothetical protein